jgi:alpha-glucosidase
MAAAVAVLSPAGSASASTAPAVVSSPDGRIAIRIDRDASRFTITRGGETVIAPSPLGLDLEGAQEFGPLALEKRDDVEVDRSIALVATKASKARDHYRGATLVFKERAPAGRRLVLDVRAYDDGVAFRYRMDDAGPVRLRGERTAFVPAGDPECLVSVATGAHEVPFERMKVSQLRDKVAYDVPLVCGTPSGRTSYAITQAHLAGYTGASLWREGEAVRVKLSAVPKRPGPVFVSKAGLTTAWRVVMMGDRAGDLIASNLIGNLNPPAEGDFSWVRAGKAAWDWYSSPMAGMKPSMDNYKRFIDFAAAAGLPYYLIDAGWAAGPNNGPGWIALPTTDITRAAEGIDMPALVRYAADKGVGLMLWAHWEHVAPRMDEVLDTFARWGIKGVKTDFMDRDDQEIVEFYHRIAQATAKRHLLLDLHGAYVPAGLQRTYPNFITQEGVMGAEWNKMGNKITPRHNLMLPYTRMLAGPIDYTPGGFRNATPASFAVNETMPQTQTTRGQALAMYVVYDSPLQMVSDAPQAYRDAAGFDFIQRVPTAWDETRFLSGTPGRDIVLARRQGGNWYLGAMAADDAGGAQRVPLRFLPPGKFRATSWEDGPTPNELVRVEREVTASDVLTLRLASAGGAAVILEPAATLTDEERSSLKFKAGSGNLAPELLLPAEDMRWWRDAKLGIFIHWGLYAIPAKGEWHMFNDKIDAKEYARLAGQFKPKHFDPDAWARVAKDAGAEYMVMTARHHDGFAMFDSPSSYGQYDSMHSAARKDFVAGYAAAARKQGLKVGIYYSPMDWRFPGYFDPKGLPENAALMKKQGYGQIRELMSNYGKIDVLWYDGGWLAHKGSDADASWFWRPEILNAEVRKLQPKVVINPRSGWQGDFATEEGAKPISGPVRPKAWEKTFTIGSGWGYVPSDQAMAPEKVIRLIIDAVVRNGNALVNMSPDADGNIPEPQVRTLQAVGAWMRVNGEGIFKTRPGPFQPVDGVYGSTVRDKHVYIHVQSWRGDRLTLPPLAQKILAAKTLSGVPVRFTQSAEGIMIGEEAANQAPADLVIRLTADAPVAPLQP